LTPISAAAALEAWGAKQNPPVMMDDVIKDVEAMDNQGGSIDQISKTNFYSFSNTAGTARCIASVYFTVSNRHAQTVAPPQDLRNRPTEKHALLSECMAILMVPRLIFRRNTAPVRT
jgi:hypothetical protein